MEKIIFKTPDAPTPTGPYSQGIAWGDLFFVAGTPGVEPSTDELVEGVENQTAKAMENILNVLALNNMDAKNILKTNMFIKNMEDFPKINKVYESFFPDGKYPVRTCVEISKTPKDGLIEIEVIAGRL